MKVKPLDDEGAIVRSLSLDSSLVSFDEILIGFRPGQNSDPRSGSGDIEPVKEMVIGLLYEPSLPGSYILSMIFFSFYFIGFKVFSP